MASENLELIVKKTVARAKALSKDYGLADSDDIRTHFQQFLKHIGQILMSALSKALTWVCRD